MVVGREGFYCNQAWGEVERDEGTENGGGGGGMVVVVVIVIVFEKSEGGKEV